MYTANIMHIRLGIEVVMSLAMVIDMFCLFSGHVHICNLLVHYTTMQFKYMVGNPTL